MLFEAESLLHTLLPLIVSSHNEVPHSGEMVFKAQTRHVQHITMYATCLPLSQSFASYYKSKAI